MNETVEDGGGWIGLFLTPQCQTTFIQNMDLLHVPCWKLLFSKLIGYLIIILSSLIVKLPQIIKLVKAGSGEGVSILSQILVTFTTSAAVAYSVARDHPISTWGESISISLQTVTIVMLLLFYAGHHLAALVTFLVYFISMAIMLSPLVPMMVHVCLQMLSLPLVTWSKVNQIWLNYRNHGTGQLSAVSIFLMNFRTLGRLYTTVMETGDVYRLGVFLVASICNTILSSQVIYYHYSNKLKHKVQ